MKPIKLTIKDLLGNIRETYVHPEAGYKECIQRMQYYPSGLPWEYVYNSSAQPWKYNGKEFVEMHGYDVYEYGARGYYATIGRFTSIDPLCEQTPWQSPYARIISKVSALTILQYINFINNKPIGRIKYALV